MTNPTSLDAFRHRTAKAMHSDDAEASDARETALMAELSGLDQMNIMLADLVRRAMRLIPEGKSLWWDEASAAIALFDEAKALAAGGKLEGE